MFEHITIVVLAIAFVYQTIMASKYKKMLNDLLITLEKAYGITPVIDKDKNDTDSDSTCF